VSLAGGPASFQRFFFSGRLPQQLTEKMLESLAARAFGRNAKLPDDTQIGWSGPRHLLDDSLAGENIAFGSFLHLGFRVDRLKAPGSVIKAYARVEEETIRQTSGREFLSRGERKKAKETAMLRIEQEVKDGAYRRMASYPVLIDLARQMVLLGSTGAGLADKFMKHFSDTFGKALEPATPEAVARRLMAGAKNPAAIDNLPPLRLVKPPDGYDADRAEAAGFAIGDLSFLGKELLTWIWHHSDDEDSRLAIRTGDDVSVLLDRSLRLKCDFGLTGTTTITADGPTGLPEARAALRVGKQPVKAGVILGGREGEFRFSLDGLRFTVSGLIVPEEDGEQDPRTRLEERFEKIAEAITLLDALFELFLSLRVSRDWSATQRRLAAWASGAPAERLMPVAGA
jgi:hypothetical protein